MESVTIVKVKADTDNNCVGCIFNKLDFHCIAVTVKLGLGICGLDKHFVISKESIEDLKDEISSLEREVEEMNE